MNLKSLDPLRTSLALTWLATAATSLVEWNGQSRDLLLRSGRVDEAWTAPLIAGGALLDLALGLALAFAPRRTTYLAALAAMGGMTVVATLLLPSLWLDPLGPLLKNLPIAAALWTLSRKTP